MKVHLIAVLVAAATAAVIAEDRSSSSALARELVTQLDAHHREALAIVDPRAPERFIAVLYVPDSQLLVVGARHPAVQALVAKIQQQQFRDVYLDLQSSPDVSGKVF